MKTLLLAPTQMEMDVVYCDNEQLDKLVCGVGGILLTKNLLNKLHKQKYDRLILIGLAGTFIPEIALGEVVTVLNDTQGDLGVFQNGEYKSFIELGIMEENYLPPSFNQTGLIFKQLKMVNSLSTNTLFEGEEKNKLRHLYYRTQIENMEGAAFHQIAEEKKIPFVHLRAISNQVGERDKSKWQLHNALGRLGSEINDYLKSIL